MLDRAAGCLTNCVRRPWRLCKQSDSTHSRRTLCASFWRHGAGDLELPSWYYTLLQHPLFDPPGIFKRQSQSGSLDHTQWAPFLYFLYPQMGMTATTPLPSRRSSRSSRRVRVHNDNSTSRKHLSSLRPATAAMPLSPESLQDPGGSNLVDYEDVAEQSLHELLDKPEHGSYREAWRLYMMIPMNRRSSETTKRLLSYLVSSPRMLDAKRALKLLDSLAPPQRSPEVYANIVTLLLRFNKLGRAVLIHAEAAEANRVSEAISTQLLQKLIDHESWQLLLTALKSLVPRRHTSQSSCDFSHVVSQYLWSALDRCYHLLSKLRSLLTVVRSSFNQEHIKKNEMLQHLIQAMIRTSLNKNSNLLSSTGDVLLILEDLKAIGLTQSWIYERTCRALLSTIGNTAGQNIHLAISVYRLYRAEAWFSPTTTLLTNILRHSMKNPAPEILKMLRLDWPLHRGHLTPAFATYLMTAYARLGHAKTVHQIFDEFREHSPLPVRLPMLQQLMQVHVLRSEPDIVKSVFDDIGSKFDLQPNTTCWNILINAYAKADNHDEAIRCLSFLLDAGLKPDMYTYGTVMASAAVTGQSAFIEELLNVVDSQRIRKSTTMLDSLVKSLINEEKLHEAEEIILQALSTPLFGSMAHMWAQLILAYGLRSDPGNAMRVYALMQEKQIKADATTYAALLRVLTIAKRTDVAFKLLTKAMPAAGVVAQPIHYLIVMNAYLTELQLSKANDLLQELRSQGFRVTPNFLSSRLRLAALEDKRDFMRRGLRHSGLRLRRMDVLFDDLLRDMDPTILTVKEPTLGSKGFRRQDQSAALYFVLAMNFYRPQGSVAVASHILRKYQQFRDNNSPNHDGRLPLGMLRALMKAYYKHRLHRQVMRCWVEAKRIVHDGLARSGDLAPAVGLVQWRYALARHLDVVVRSLRTIPHGTTKVKHLMKTYLADGYALDALNWNVLVEVSVLRDPVFAFRICEENLMGPSFSPLRPLDQEKVAISWDRDQSLNTVRRSVSRMMQINVSPKTADRLRRSLRELRASAVFLPESRRDLDRIHTIAPKTISAIE